MQREISSIKHTRYFAEQVLRKRPYLCIEWCLRIIRDPLEKVVQDDGRIRYYGFVEEFDKYLRVVTLEDGETLHNAFPDRGYSPRKDG